MAPEVTSEQKRQTGASRERSGASEATRDNLEHEAPGALSPAFARSVRHNTIAEILVQVVRAGGLVILARALDPGDFGTFKILAAVSVFAMICCQSGFPDALIQREDLTPEHEATGFWITVAMALLVGVGLCLLAPYIAAWMEMPRLRTGLLLIAGPVVIECISASPGARLRRRLDFRAIAIAEVSAEVSFLLAAIAVLWLLHLPRWSLAVGLGARLFVHGATIWFADGYFPLHAPRLSAINDLRDFVVRVWLAATLEVTSGNADYVLVGRLLGSDALGYYSMAWDLLRFIPDRLHRMAGRVTLPEFCRLQNSDERMRNAYLNFMSYVAKIVLPVLFCVAIAAPELVGTIYGRKWLPTALPLRLLTPGLALVGLRMAIGSIYFAKNRPSFDIYLHSGRLVLIAAAIFVSARFGIAGVSAGMSLVESLVGLAGIDLACWLIGLRPLAFGRALLPAFKLSLACAAATALGKLLIVTLEIKGITALALLIALPAVVFWILERQSLLRFAGVAGHAETLAIE